MNQLANINSGVTMSSLDFLNNFINPERERNNEKPHENGKFMLKVEDELDDLPAPTFVRRFGNNVKIYELNLEQMTLVGMRESKAVRRSVLEQLKKLAAPKLPDFTNPAEAARAWADQVESVMRLERKVATDAPKVDFAERVGKSSGVLIGDFGKAVGIGQNRLFAWLRAQGYLIATAGARHNTPYQRYIDSGHFDVTEQTYETPSGETRSRFTPHITGKGQVFITTKLKECGMIKEIL